MSLGISLINDMLLKTGLRMAYRDKSAQIEIAAQDLMTRIRLPGRERGEHHHPAATLIVPRRSIGYYELTTHDSRPIKLETLIVNELAKLRKRVESEGGERFESCCAAVPPCYFDMQRSALREAVQQCGIAEVALINEPVALLKTRRQDGKYLVACLEDGIFYLSLMARSGENVVELASGGDAKWGGVELIHSLARYTLDLRGGPGRNPDSNYWKQGFSEAYSLLKEVLEQRYVSEAIRNFVSEFTLMTRGKITRELDRVLEIGRQRPQDITRCLLLGDLWNLPDMKKAFAALPGAQTERVSADRIAEGALLASEEQEARAPRPIAPVSQGTHVPIKIPILPDVPALEEEAEPPSPKEEEQLRPSQPASIFLLSDYANEASLAPPAAERAEPPTASAEEPQEKLPSFDIPAPVVGQAASPQTNPPAVEPVAFDLSPSADAGKTAPLSAEALAALIQQSGQHLDAAQGVAFYKLLLTRLRQQAAEHCAREAASASVVNDMAGYINLLREGYAFDPADTGISRRLADACCAQCERVLQHQNIAVPLHWVEEALQYAPQHKRARELKAFLQGRRGGSIRSSKGR